MRGPVPGEIFTLNRRLVWMYSPVVLSQLPSGANLAFHDG
jgi:hypothetical protein